jgi:hypothetical protein
MVSSLAASALSESFLMLVRLLSGRNNRGRAHLFQFEIRDRWSRFCGWSMVVRMVVRIR